MKIELLSLGREDWREIAENHHAFVARHRLVERVEHELLRNVAEQTLALFERTGVDTRPWTGFLAVDRAHRTIVGTCGFTSGPDPSGAVEIAYFTFPKFEGRGVATAMAGGLVGVALRSVGVQRLLAHTLPEQNASTRVLEKAGFVRTGDAVDEDVGLVWRWERDAL